MENITSEITSDPINKLTVGEEFINWAEQYWHFEKNYTIQDKENSEICPYEAIRNIFINKVDEIIKNRL